MERAGRPPNRPEESENKTGYKVIFLSLDWKQGSKSQYVIIKVDRPHKISRNTPVVKTVPRFRNYYPNQYCSNHEVKASQGLCVTKLNLLD